LKWAQLKDRPSLINLRTKTQNQQAQILIDFIEQQEGAMVLSCDCNSMETSESMRMLSKVLLSGSRETGWRPFGRTLNGTEPDNGLWRIDYVLFRGEFEAVGAFLLNDSGGSDHRPVLMQFR
jgi:endonuclease/exonuclease/phosphatase (EEP) superfamily protein YafD